jgi:hypothetical protein
MTRKEEKMKDVANAEIRNAIYSYFHKNKSLDKCVVQKYARSAFKGLRNGRPPGTVS